MGIFGRSIILAGGDSAQQIARERAQDRYGTEKRVTRVDPYDSLTGTEKRILEYIADGGSHYFGNVANALELDMNLVTGTMRAMVPRLSYGKRNGASADNLRFIADLAKSKGVI